MYWTGLYKQKDINLQKEDRLYVFDLLFDCFKNDQRMEDTYL